MNIVYTTNEAFTGKVAAGICSVFENNMDMERITIYIVGQNLSRKSIEDYKKLGLKYNRKIEVISIDNVQTYLDFKCNTGGWNSIILARLFIDKLLPEEVERVIYLDGDTINVGSLEKLWETDMKGKIVGACIEATVDKNRKKLLGMKNIPYVNSGVLLINLSLWRKNEIGKKILEFCKNNEGKLSATDQDAINGTLKDQIYYLEPQYNFYNIYWLYPYKVLKKLMKSNYYYSESTVKKATESPVIIHYLGEERPWRKGNRHKFRSYYNKYLHKTPWRREAMEEGWELYYVCWGLFNFVMRPFPMFRYQIINQLIPFFLRWRAGKLKEENR